MKLLRINTSVFDSGTLNGEEVVSQGVSTQLSDTLVARLRQINPAVQVTTRDFATQAVPHLDGPRLRALSTAAEARTAEQQQMVDYADGLIAELQQADVLVIAAPMYNFTIPSMLKSWIDHVARAGVSFKYTETGPQGLLGGKKIYLVATSGGVHEAGISDYVRPYLRTALGLLGLDDIEIISASGLNLGEEARAKGLQQAQTDVASAAGNFQQFVTTNQRGKAA